jgi:hypothetical protein
MAESLTFLKLAKLVLEVNRCPLSPQEIWDYAIETGLTNRIKTNGKTPWDSVSARIYVDIKDNPDSPFSQYSNKPVKFFLKDYPITTENQEKRTRKKS